jgi:hypothetical protein
MEAILYAAVIGDELRKAISESRRNIDYSRRLIKEAKIILDQSRLIILASQRLIFKDCSNDTGLVEVSKTPKGAGIRTASHLR